MGGHKLLDCNDLCITQSLFGKTCYEVTKSKEEIVMLYWQGWRVNTSDGKKREFNTVITALSLALGFNLAASFKAMAIDMRWWILSRKRRSLREVCYLITIFWKSTCWDLHAQVDLILNCDSMMNVVHLMRVAPRPRVIFACLSWLALNLVSPWYWGYSSDSWNSFSDTPFQQ